MKHREKLEAETARYIAQVTTFYENVSTTKLTNICQLFVFATSSNLVGYPYWHEHYFRKFHKDSGFTNSVLENYVVVEPGIHVPSLKGELVCLNAKPYRNREGKLERMLICNVEKRYVFGPYAEEHLHTLFQKANRKIPTGNSLPRPPPGPPIVEHKPRLTTENIFKRIAVSIGLQQSLWLTLFIGAVFVAITVLIVIVLWTGRRSHTKI
jgi:hypothetical protein